MTLRTRDELGYTGHRATRSPNNDSIEIEKDEGEVVLRIEALKIPGTDENGDPIIIRKAILDLGPVGEEEDPG